MFPAHGDYIHHWGTGSFFINADECARGMDNYLAMNAAPSAAPIIIEFHSSMCGDSLDDRPEVAACINAICSGTRVPLGIRSQLTALPSFYYLHVEGGARCSYAQ